MIAALRKRCLAFCRSADGARRRECYVVQFQHRRPSLRRNDPVAHETLNGISVCGHDTKRGLLRYGISDSRLGPPCAIPGFQQLSQEQLDALELAPRAKN